MKSIRRQDALFVIFWALTRRRQGFPPWPTARAKGMPREQQDISDPLTRAFDRVWQDLRDAVASNNETWTRKLAPSDNGRCAIPGCHRQRTDGPFCNPDYQKIRRRIQAGKYDEGDLRRRGKLTESEIDRWLKQ